MLLTNCMSAKKNYKQKGFTLIELIVGIVVLSITYAVLTSLIYPMASQSAAQVHQIRAAELGQSMINEILGKAFDENSDMSGGFVRCGEISALSCTASSNLGAEPGEQRNNFDDVDDYNSINFGDEIVNSSGNSLADIYMGFNMNVSVINDSDYSGEYQSATDNEKTAKLITITVRSPQNDDYVFSVYKANF
ncbi:MULTISPECIES: type II secretion system protein [unclassified Colwellia]|uniref:type II secretion system protein n=1 Tax=unclassified Colwellia TaxID=196834 RepID=UPI0015F7568E|nr:MULTISPECIES: type II secretion system protein [unclassified Colwellia]MBA6355967.1 type II secretion system protein [Colwellia sp. BRX8-3]MBA6359629.1 type II secretion system protein [Colwellia sp. BRX8-6]MBA6366216.1 type II secretion system protein [Colwellia sp. BRX8-5]MBA6374630.1 type II secretion system protein [Colwellia sp. BRX8-2]MBA6378722.1 type II secretion system protein [Colwellia sp. BRX10-7]